MAGMAALALASCCQFFLQRQRRRTSPPFTLFTCPSPKGEGQRQECPIYLGLAAAAAALMTQNAAGIGTTDADTTDVVGDMRLLSCAGRFS